MKQYIIVFICLLLFAACTNDKRAVLRCKLDHANPRMTYLTYLTGSGKHLIDSCAISSSGRIKYHIKLEKIGFYELYFKDRKSLNFIISPGERITVSADYNNIYNSKLIAGSPNTNRLNILLDTLWQVQQNLNLLREHYNSLKTDSMTTHKTDSIGRLYQQVIDKHKKFSVSYILQDIGSLANIFALYQEYEPGFYVFSRYKDIQYFKIVSDSLSKHYPGLAYVKQLKNDVSGMLANFEIQKLIKVNDPGEHLPDLTYPGTDGNNISLSSLKGKVVLLSFWSSDHAESLKNMDALKGIYRKYQNRGFEIFQVAVDPSFSSWRRRVYFEEIMWPSVCDTLFPNSKTRMAYNVVGIPMNYLISRDQTEILAKNLSPEGLDLKLSTLLN